MPHKFNVQAYRRYFFIIRFKYEAVHRKLTNVLFCRKLDQTIIEDGGFSM